MQGVSEAVLQRAWIRDSGYTASIWDMLVTNELSARLFGAVNTVQTRNGISEVVAQDPCSQ